MKYYKCEICKSTQVETEFGECAECSYENLIEITEAEYNGESKMTVENKIQEYVNK